MTSYRRLSRVERTTAHCRYALRLAAHVLQLFQGVLQVHRDCGIAQRFALRTPQGKLGRTSGLTRPGPALRLRLVLDWTVRGNGVR